MYQQEIDKSAPIGVLVMAYGGPNSINEVPGYLADIRSGRPTTVAVLDEITRNYESIGGKSPLLELTKQQIETLEEHFDNKQYKFYLGMRHWAPWIEETIRDMIQDGINKAVSIVLAPHYSILSVAKYQSKIEDGLDLYRGKIQFSHVKNYHTAPGLIVAFTKRVFDGINLFPEECRDDVHILFSAHSLPVRIMKIGDPYEEQLYETAELVAANAGLTKDRWSWCYQSAGRSLEPWLGPQIQDFLPELARKGIKNIVSIPVGFVTDHVEILFDIDIQAKQVAEECGIRLERPPALNSDPLFIEAVAETIQKQVIEASW